jgi:hypothetical protein
MKFFTFLLVKTRKIQPPRPPREFLMGLLLPSLSIKMLHLGVRDPLLQELGVSPFSFNI